MSKKIFNIIDYISEKEIIDKINEIGKNPLTITGHGFNDFYRKYNIDRQLFNININTITST